MNNRLRFHIDSARAYSHFSNKEKVEEKPRNMDDDYKVVDTRKKKKGDRILWISLFLAKKSYNLFLLVLILWLDPEDERNVEFKLSDVVDMKKLMMIVTKDWGFIQSICVGKKLVFIYFNRK